MCFTAAFSLNSYMLGLYSGLYINPLAAIVWKNLAHTHTTCRRKEHCIRITQKHEQQTRTHYKLQFRLVLRFSNPKAPPHGPVCVRRIKQSGSLLCVFVFGSGRLIYLFSSFKYTRWWKIESQ